MRALLSIQNLLVYSLALELGISCFLCYVIFTITRVGSIRIRIFTSAKVRNITSIPLVA
jgi:hypothetical protein